MIDRHGNRVRVGWLPHEIVWLEAAITLSIGDRMAAFRDISELTGRTLTAVQHKSYEIRAIQRMNAAKPRRVVMRLPDPSMLARSSIRPPTMAQLMGGRARPRRQYLEAAE